MGFVRRLATVAFALAAINFFALAIVSHYDVRFGPIHLAAGYLFKPLLYLDASFLIVLALRYQRESAYMPQRCESFASPAWFLAVSAAAIVAIYAISVSINLDFPDWTHRTITSHMHAWDFFTRKQYDGFYRPLVFVSLWLDWKIFGNALWGFHIQNLLLHFLNAWLAARLAFRLGFDQSLSAWTGLAFLAVPASFEAVIWPGARFDLMASAFTLLALERALAGAAITAAVAYSLGALSKETAYAFPLLLAALFLMRKSFAPTLSIRQWGRVLVGVFAATLVMLVVRVAIYGNLGGYPDVAKGAGNNVNFQLHAKTFTGIATRLPAAVFLINTGAGLPLWLRADLIVFTGLLAVVVFSRANAGRWTALLILAVLSVLPMLNMFGWMTQYAQQGRYLYHPVIWVVIVMAAAIAKMRWRRALFPLWIGTMLVAALFNELVYVSMMRVIRTATSEAVQACNNAGCCRNLYLAGMPWSWNGAFYFQYQVVHDVQAALPKVSVTATAPPQQTCALVLDWDGARFTTGSDNERASPSAH